MSKYSMGDALRIKNQLLGLSKNEWTIKYCIF